MKADDQEDERASRPAVATTTLDTVVIDVENHAAPGVFFTTIRISAAARLRALKDIACKKLKLEAFDAEELRFRHIDAAGGRAQLVEHEMVLCDSVGSRLALEQGVSTQPHERLINVGFILPGSDSHDSDAQETVATSPASTTADFHSALQSVKVPKVMSIGEFKLFILSSLGAPPQLKPSYVQILPDEVVYGGGTPSGNTYAALLFKDNSVSIGSVTTHCQKLWLRASPEPLAPTRPKIQRRSSLGVIKTQSSKQSRPKITRRRSMPATSSLAALEGTASNTGGINEMSGFKLPEPKPVDVNYNDELHREKMKKMAQGEMFLQRRGESSVAKKSTKAQEARAREKHNLQESEALLDYEAVQERLGRTDSQESKNFTVTSPSQDFNQWLRAHPTLDFSGNEGNQSRLRLPGLRKSPGSRRQPQSYDEKYISYSRRKRSPHTARRPQSVSPVRQTVFHIQHPRKNSGSMRKLGISVHHRGHALARRRKQELLQQEYDNRYAGRQWNDSSDEEGGFDDSIPLIQFGEEGGRRQNPRLQHTKDWLRRVRERGGVVPNRHFEKFAVAQAFHGGR